MGKTFQGILGELSGKVGNVIGGIEKVLTTSELSHQVWQILGQRVKLISVINLLLH